METLLIFNQIFSQLHNSAAAAYFSYLGVSEVPNLFTEGTLDEVEAQRARYDITLQKASAFHPSLDLIHSWDVTNPRLQVRGTWTRLSPRNKFCRPSFRNSVATFVYGNKFYVFSGHRAVIDMIHMIREECCDLWLVPFTLSQFVF